MNNNFLKVVIMQGQIPHYRVPFFNALGSSDSIDLTVVHSGSPMCPHGLIFFKEIILHKKEFCGFVWQPCLISMAKDCDVIIAMFDFHWISIVLSGLIWRNKTILWGHAFGSRTSGCLARLRIFIAKCCRALMLYESCERLAFVGRGVATEKVFYAGNTVEVIHAGRNSSSLRNSFLFVGRLHQRKRLTDFIMAYAKAFPLFSLPFELNLIGDGLERSRLEQLTHDLGLDDQVHFHGEILDESIVKSFFDQAVAYVSPGWTGLSVLHSFAYGVPVVTFAEGPHPPEVSNIIHGVNGLLIDGGLDALSDALVRLANDRGYANQLGIAAASYYRDQRSMPLMVKRFQQAINYVAMER